LAHVVLGTAIPMTSPQAADNGRRRRRTPSQVRSRETFEAICAAAADLIADEGITALNTNAVAQRAGVSITSVYAYFPDKWAIVQELFDRFERLRVEYVADAFAQLQTAEDWRAGLVDAWRRLVRFRTEIPGGVALRRSADATPSLGEIHRAWSDRAARDFAAVIRARRPDVDDDEAYRVAWAATLVAGRLLDDVCVTGEIDEVKLKTATRLMLDWFAPYLDPPGAAGTVPGAAGTAPGDTD
jgi:AcrR family transcriptional regulator